MSCQPHRVTSGQSNSCKPMRKGMMLLSEHLFCSVKCIMFDLTVKTNNKHNMGDSQLCDEDLISSCWFSGSPVPFWHKHAHNYRKEQQQIVCMSKQCMYFKHHIWHIQTNLSNLWTWSILIYKSGKRLRIFYPKKAFLTRRVLKSFSEGVAKLMWVGKGFQTFGTWNLKEHWPADLLFALGIERSLLLLDLREQEGP